MAGFAGEPVGGAAVEVSLRSPVPLDRELEVVEEGGAVRLLDSETLVAEARTASGFEPNVPEAVDLEEARRAAARYRGSDDGPFSRCFVCGRAREDALGVFAGPVEGRSLVASRWTPAAWAAGPDGNVLPELVWAALDCPTYFAAYPGEESTVSFLARLTGQVLSPVPVSGEHVVIAWALGVDGRKRRAGSAVLSAAGEALAVAEALLIEPRRD